MEMNHIYLAKHEKLCDVKEPKGFCLWLPAAFGLKIYISKSFYSIICVTDVTFFVYMGDFYD